MAQILLVYSSVYGLSKRICERIAARLSAQGEAPHMAELTDETIDPARFDAIVVGASIKHGKHHPTVLAFLRRHCAVLDARPSALFSVSLIARKPGRNTPETNPYLRALVAQSPWKPKLLAVFAGELDYARYGPWDRQMMRLVMWINRGPTDPRSRVTFTDWSEVDRFAARMLQLVRGTAAAPAPSPETLAESPVVAH